MNKKLMNTITAAALSALVLAPLATVGTLAMTDTAWAAGKGKEKDRDRGRSGESRSTRSTASTSTPGSQAEGANAKGMEMKAAAQAKKSAGIQLASLSSGLAPTTSPFPAPRPNRGQFASEWKAMNAIWANENAFENASENSRLARILDYRDALVEFNAMVSRKAELEATYEVDKNTIEALILALEADPVANAEALSDLYELQGIYDGYDMAEGDLQGALDTAAAGAEPPEGDALTAFNELLLEKFPVEAE